MDKSTVTYHDYIDRKEHVDVFLLSKRNVRLRSYASEICPSWVLATKRRQHEPQTVPHKEERSRSFGTMCKDVP